MTLRFYTVNGKLRYIPTKEDESNIELTQLPAPKPKVTEESRKDKTLSRRRNRVI